MVEATYGAHARHNTRVVGRRVAATLLDVAIAVFAGWLLALPGAVAAGAGDGNFISEYIYNHLSILLGWYGLAVFFVLYPAYYVLMEGLYGRTLGKMAAGVKVVRQDDGGRPGFGKAALRAVLLFTVDGFMWFAVAFFVALVSDDNRRLGDMVAKTLVVRA